MWIVSIVGKNSEGETVRESFEYAELRMVYVTKEPEAVHDERDT